jgi:hypothetical protein
MGHGPGEYVSIDDFCVDTVGKIIYVLDGATDRIHKYELYSGKHIKSVRLSKELSAGYSRFSYMDYKNKTLYISVSGRDYTDAINGFLLHKIDFDSGESVESLFDVKEYNKGKINMKLPFMHTTQGDIKYNTVFMNMIMSVSENEAAPFLTFTGNEMITEEEMKDINMTEYDDTMDRRIRALKKIWHFFDYFEGPDFIHTNFYKGSIIESVLYYPQTKQAKCFHRSVDDVLYVPSYKLSLSYNMFLSADKKGIYTSINLFGIEDFIKNRDNGELSPSLMNSPKIYEVNEDSNPLVFYYEFKD